MLRFHFIKYFLIYKTHHANINTSKICKEIFMKFKTSGVCSRAIDFDVVDGKVVNVH